MKLLPILLVIILASTVSALQYCPPENEFTTESRDVGSVCVQSCGPKGPCDTTDSNANTCAEFLPGSIEINYHRTRELCDLGTGGSAEIDYVDMRYCCSTNCGNNIIEPGEECDGTAIPLTCADYGAGTGTPTCTAQCKMDISLCPGNCGNGVCEASRGETSASCASDCLETAVCPGAGIMHWDGAVSLCVCNNGGSWNGVSCTASNCGASTPVGTNCATLTGAPDAGYYCSDGYNTDDNNPVTGICCPIGDYWDAGSHSCIGTSQCNIPLICPQATTYPSNLASYVANSACAGPTANDEQAPSLMPGACCAVGPKYGQPNAYYYSDAYGRTNSNFEIY
jgi:hypothetical protein